MLQPLPCLQLTEFVLADALGRTIAARLVPLLDNALLLRATRPIAAGEEVTFDYLDLAHERAVGGSDGGGGEAPSASERREMLREHFGFTCECPACVPR